MSNQSETDETIERIVTKIAEFITEGLASRAAKRLTALLHEHEAAGGTANPEFATVRAQVEHEIAESLSHHAVRDLHTKIVQAQQLIDRQLGEVPTEPPPAGIWVVHNELAHANVILVGVAEQLNELATKSKPEVQPENQPEVAGGGEIVPSPQPATLDAERLQRAADEGAALEDKHEALDLIGPATAPAESVWRPCRKRPVVEHVRDAVVDGKVFTRKGLAPPMRPDDLVLRGVNGELAIIGRDLFSRTYDLLDDTTPPASNDPSKEVNHAGAQPIEPTRTVGKSPDTSTSQAVQDGSPGVAHAALRVALEQVRSKLQLMHRALPRYPTLGSMGGGSIRESELQERWEREVGPFRSVFLQLQDAVETGLQIAERALAVDPQCEPRCARCGEPVEPNRRCYAIPHCYACLPPPPELPTVQDGPNPLACPQCGAAPFIGSCRSCGFNPVRDAEDERRKSAFTASIPIRTTTIGSTQVQSPTRNSEWSPFSMCATPKNWGAYGGEGEGWYCAVGVVDGFDPLPNLSATGEGDSMDDAELDALRKLLPLLVAYAPTTAAHHRTQLRAIESAARRLRAAVPQ